MLPPNGACERTGACIVGPLPALEPVGGQVVGQFGYGVFWAVSVTAGGSLGNHRYHGGRFGGTMYDGPYLMSKRQTKSIWSGRSSARADTATKAPARTSPRVRRDFMVRVLVRGCESVLRATLADEPSRIHRRPLDRAAKSGRARRPSGTTRRVELGPHESVADEVDRRRLPAPELRQHAHGLGPVQP